MSETPPCRSRPSRVGFDTMTTTDAMSIPATRRRTRRWRRRSVIAYSIGRSLLGREHEQHPAVVVVGREQVRGRLGREVALGVDLHGFVPRAAAPFEDRSDRVLAAREAQPEHVRDVTPDDTP